MIFKCYLLVNVSLKRNKAKTVKKFFEKSLKPRIENKHSYL